jgi:hypothetical protein
VTGLAAIAAPAHAINDDVLILLLVDKRRRVLVAAKRTVNHCAKAVGAYVQSAHARLKTQRAETDRGFKFVAAQLHHGVSRRFTLKFKTQHHDLTLTNIRRRSPPIIDTA